MKKCLLFSILFFGIHFFCPAQTNTLKGKIVSNFNDLQGINIENTSQKKSYFTQKQGYFSISAKVGDTLVFSAVSFKGIKIALKKEDFSQELFFVNLDVTTNFLQEIVVTKEKNGYEMGILSKKAKEFTPAERKLNTASNFYPSATVGTMSGGSLGLDPVLNWISGRTKMLKKDLKVERTEIALQKINNLFEEDYFIKTLKIPIENVKGFQYFLVQDTEFVTALNSKNKTMAKFLMIGLASNYLDLQKQK